ncbi:PD-(D/E)XK nuclease family protein [Kangiella sp.]|uniref:PD-(D/E)XK nuclease family protein n=1 Tax=Kangiella sp. TaxID=1920245 RepID=UPI003A910AE3
MDIEQLTALVDAFKQLPQVKRETTIFDIGSRGHFENPMTEVLSFFCNTAEVHEMNDLVISSIVSLIRQNVIYQNLQNGQVHGRPQREVTTKNNKRIDLLLSSDEWVIAIESKVNHQQINPFEEYEGYVDSLIRSNKSLNTDNDLTDETEKRAVFVILSPDGKVDNAHLNHRWCGISFQHLVDEIKTRLQEHFFDAPFNKWSLVLKDFLLHLENLVNDVKQNSAQEEFILTHLSEISQAWNLLKSTLESVQQKAHTKLEQHPELRDVLRSQKASWFGLPTTILCSKDELTEVVLFATSAPSDIVDDDQRNAGKHIFIQIQVQTDNSELELVNIHESLANKAINRWYSSGYCFFRWPINALSIEEITKEFVATFEAIEGLSSMPLQSL